jgi:hypothetical protein
MTGLCHENQTDTQTHRLTDTDTETDTHESGSLDFAMKIRLIHRQTHRQTDTDIKTHTHKTDKHTDRHTQIYDHAL